MVLTQTIQNRLARVAAYYADRNAAQRLIEKEANCPDSLLATERGSRDFLATQQKMYEARCRNKIAGKLSILENSLADMREASERASGRDRRRSDADRDPFFG